jgi:NAD(P)-dependent dehydrogenase (short-subunit alcohol dehydrogenase family)
MSEDLFNVSGQVVLVSGGSRGIGRAIAEGFAQRGARVIITGRDQAALEQTAAAIAAAGGKVQGLVCDVAKPAGIKLLVERVLRDCERIDTLINSAGVNRRKPAATVTEEDYDYLLDINLKGAFLLSQAVGRAMINQHSGSQINIASLATDRPLKHAGPYAISKAGMGQMTRSLALEWGPHGIRVNAIAPGFIVTDLTRKLWTDEKMQAWAQANTPQRRLGQPQDLVGAALFLASPAAAFMTGQILYVDGGFSAGWAWPIPE